MHRLLKPDGVDAPNTSKPNPSSLRCIVASLFIINLCATLINFPKAWIAESSFSYPWQKKIKINRESEVYGCLPPNSNGACQVAGQVPFQVDGQVAFQVAGQVDGQVDGQVAGQVFFQVSGQVAFQVAGQVAGQFAGQVACLVAVQVQCIWNPDACQLGFPTRRWHNGQRC